MDTFTFLRTTNARLRSIFRQHGVMTYAPDIPEYSQVSQFASALVREPEELVADAWSDLTGLTDADKRNYLSAILGIGHDKSWTERMGDTFVDNFTSREDVPEHFQDINSLDELLQRFLPGVAQYMTRGDLALFVKVDADTPGAIQDKYRPGMYARPLNSEDAHKMLENFTF